MRNEIIFCIEEANKMERIRVILITGDPVIIMNSFSF